MMQNPISFARGFDDETKFSFIILAITKAIGKIPSVANNKIYTAILSSSWVLKRATIAQIIVPAIGIETERFAACSNSFLY
ncbi:MAG: hypothetical protein HRT53_16365 [Colwellia sp.]|nr:hypothetical protein [Colwellia sp.]